MSDLSPSQRKALKMLGANEETTGLVLELSIRMVEAMTEDGAFDIAKMAPNVRGAFEIVMRRRAKGLDRIQRAFALPKIIDSRDPGNRDPFGFNNR